MGRIRYNQAGYAGFSRSVRATAAEAAGKLPLTRAIVAVAARARCTQKLAREALTAVGPCEWHHTGSHARRTDYYLPAAAVAWLAARPVLALLPPDWRDSVGRAMSAVAPGSPAARGAARDAELSRLATAVGCDASLLTAAYYGLWNDEAEVAAEEGLLV